MKTLTLTAIALVATLTSQAQVKNAKTETYNVSGNCEMCKQRIETAAFKRKESKANWDKETHLLTLKYDSVKTTANTVLQRIADAGYDNEKFTTTTNVYNNLPSCCQYERKKASSK
ncbi:MAG: copper chaperone [Bacteroidia bacterium]|nr:copper chaperone [Bacteroidia bacterium]